MDNDAPGMPPPNFALSQFAISVGAREISFILGHTRHMVNKETGLPTQQAVEWLASYAMSPTTAKQLHGALNQVLEGYEKQFGKIPTDLNSKVALTDVVSI